jgi:hypothetical protein
MQPSCSDKQKSYKPERTGSKASTDKDGKDVQRGIWGEGPGMIMRAGKTIWQEGS